MLRLQLYVVGRAARSQLAVANLVRLCEARVPGGYELEVVDVIEHPEAAEAANVLATPTVIRLEPKPACRIVGDLSHADVLLRGLGLDDEEPGEIPDGS